MSRQHRPIAVLFDLDGTLIDSIQLLLDSVRHAFDGYPSPAPTDEQWIAGIGTPLAKQLRAFAASDEDVVALTARYRAYQNAEHDRLTTLYPGTAEVLETLHRRGHPMGIVTSKSNAMMDRALSHTDILRYMRTTIGCDSCALHKPDPFPVRMALDELGYTPDEAVFVGDSPHDVNAGNAAGVVTIGALWGPFSEQQLTVARPAFTARSVTELPELVERIDARIHARAAV